MRLKERTLTEIEIAPRLHTQGALGGQSEAFSATRTTVRASVLPDGGSTQQKEKGLLDRERLRLLVPADTTVAAGDAVIVGDRTYVIIAVQRWTAHLELECEARV